MRTTSTLPSTADKAARPTHIHKAPFAEGARFTRIGAQVLNDTDLMAESTLAYTILIHLLGRPPTWQINTEYFHARGFGGKNQIRKAFLVLQRRGYMTRAAVKRADGKHDGYIYDIHEIPIAVEGTGQTPASAAGASNQCSGPEPAHQTDASDGNVFAGQDQRTESVRIVITENPKGSQSSNNQGCADQPERGQGFLEKKPTPSRRPGIKLVLQPSRPGQRSQPDLSPFELRQQTQRRRRIIARPDGWVHPHTQECLEIAHRPGQDPAHIEKMLNVAQQNQDRYEHVTHIYSDTRQPVMDQDLPFVTASGA